VRIEQLIKQAMTEKVKEISFEDKILLAAEERRYEIVKLLIENGVNFNIVDNYSETLLHLGSQEG
jgi:ankyrin repeat protein